MKRKILIERYGTAVKKTPAARTNEAILVRMVSAAAMATVYVAD